MAYQALARKWRPQNFAELVGQEHVVTALTNALRTQRLHHAYLFTGTRGVGKTTLARILAKSLNCETGITPTPCGACATCVSIDRGGFVDLLEVDAATNTRVEEMRELLDNTQYLPTSGRFKIYIIDEVHMLSRSAFNSMLKTLEEPPEHVKFILATTDPQKVPVTVLSRCLQFNLKQMSRQMIAGHLADVLRGENIVFDAAAVDAVAQAAQGSMRDGLSLLDQAIAHGGGKVAIDTVVAMLGAIDRGYLLELLTCVAKSDGAGALAEAERMAAMSLSFEAALQEMASLLHQIALRQVLPEAAQGSAAEESRLQWLAQNLSPQDVQLFYQIAITGRRDLALAPDEFAGFAMTMMRMLSFAVKSSAGPVAVEPENREAKLVSPVARAVDPITTERVSRNRLTQTDTPLVEQAQAQPAKDETTKTFDRDWDGDWLRLTVDLKLAGMAGMLARHCELKSFLGSRVELSVPEEHRRLAEKGYIDKLQSALASHFGVPFQVRVTVGVANGNSLDEVEQRQQRTRQAEAVAAIEGDTFVRDLVEHLDARLIESSIRPIQEQE